MTTLSLHYKKLLLFGDSITEYSYNPYAYSSEKKPKSPQFGFGAYVTNKYTRRLDVVQRGYAGYNSDQAREIYPKVLSHLEDVVFGTLFFGTNDAVASGPQAVPLDRYLENMEYIIDLALERNIKLVVFGPALHDANLWDKVMTPEDRLAGRFRSNERNKQYLEALKSLCERKKVAFGDLYTAFSQYRDSSQLLSDGIHYSGKGYEVMARVFDDAVRKTYPELLPENLDLVLPLWRDIGDLMQHLS